MSFTEQWRLVKGPEGCTKIPQAEQAAQLENPGPVYLFRGHLYKKGEDGSLVLLNPLGKEKKEQEKGQKDEQTIRLLLLQQSEEKWQKREEEKKKIAERALALGWPPKIVFMRI